MIAEKSDIARGFGRARATYESASRLQRFMGNTLLQRLELLPVSESPMRILDLGSGTGWFTRKLQACYPTSLVTGADLSHGMIQQAKVASVPDIHWLVADAENLPLPEHSFDLIFSNLMIQWCDDPGQVLRECRRLLRPAGRLMMSTLLDGTLRELRQAWAEADPGQEHVNRFQPYSVLRGGAGAELPGVTVETRTIELPYPSPMALAGELKQLGAGFKGRERRRTMTAPGRVRAMCRHYPTRPDGRIAASYEAGWIYWQRAQ
ncbi:malonyl-[acyl-carrier protein] O-methyltransferase BioC [Marinobacter salinus]|uniref:Malonyl-[acyl-carrier protein] O-methyltransferase n=1 Tax=Marinobacter salinus TaxID=1874317 RepID=A0A1D9GR37_9GAMM|nr:malonyl-[acyl-carrier protein] O-methyltransferase BioC [Marinobacter salinus]